MAISIPLFGIPAEIVSISGHVQILNAFSSIFFQSERLPLLASRGKMKQRTHFSSIKLTWYWKNLLAMRREIILQRFSVTQLNTATNVSSFHFACIRGHLLCYSIDSGQIFLNKSFRKSLWLQSRPYVGDSWHPPCMAKSISHTGRCLASHTCEFADHVSTPCIMHVLNK